VGQDNLQKMFGEKAMSDVKEPINFWIEFWSLDTVSGDTEVKNVFVKRPKHWPKKPVLQYHAVEASALDAANAEINRLTYELDKSRDSHMKEISRLSNEFAKLNFKNARF
jgi:hypothetical protein